MALTLRTKILLGYGLVLALLVSVVVSAFFSLRVLSNAGAAILRENYRSILAAERMREALGNQDNATLLLVLGRDEEGLIQFRRSEQDFLQWLARAKDNVTVEGEDRVVEEIDSRYGRYLVESSHLWDAIARDASGGRQAYQEAVLPALHAVEESCEKLRLMNERTMFAANERAARLARRALWSVLLIGGAAVVVGLGSSLLLSHLLARPLRELMAATRRVAEGDYDVELRATRRDEVGGLAAEFNAMAAKLRSYRDMNMELLMGEQRRSEAVVRAIDDGIVVVDRNLVVSHVNPLAADAFGTNPDAAQGRHVLEVVKDEQLFTLIKDAAESGQAPTIPEGRNTLTVRRGEQRRHFLFSIVPVKGQGSRMYGVLLVLRDVTRLKELDQLKSEFVMTASHQLRTPLTSISMSIGLLRESAARKLGDKERQLLATAQEETQRLSSLVSDLLDLSRIEAGRLELAFAPVAIEELFDRTIGMLKPQAEEKGIALSSQVRGKLQPVRADAGKIVWVLTNLVANALRYTNKGGHVQLTAEEAGTQAHLSVADDGAGIPYEYQSRIFDKFAQVKGDSEPGGTGLGLAICREIARAHGGGIWVESAPGKGTTFTFTLPLAQAGSDAPKGGTP